MKIKSLTFLLLALLSINSFTASAVPSTLSYQGYLTDTSGSPINGTVNVTFTLYDTQIAIASSWTETQAVTVAQGLFQVQLGASTPLPLGLFDIPLWLGLQVAGDAEMLPRQALSATPYAHQAENAETLAGMVPADYDQSSHVNDSGNPHNVSAAQTGAADAASLNAHTGSSANPHSVTAAQAGAASTADLTTHSNNTSAHHTRFSNLDAVSAMGGKSDANPLNHDQYHNGLAIAAIKADDGTGLNADTVDNLHANEIIAAASDEVRTPISRLPFTISTSGSYYLTQNLTATAGLGNQSIDILVDKVSIDLMGFVLEGNGVNDHGIYLQGRSVIVINNGTVSGFGFAGISGGNSLSAGDANVVSDVLAIGNGSLGKSSSYSGIYLSGSSNRVERCIAKDNGGDGIHVGNNSIIKDSSAENSGGSGGIVGGSNAILSNNSSYNNQDGGIFGGTSAILNNNSSYNNQGGGVFGGESATLSNNTARNNGTYGIFGSNSTNLTNNTARNNQGDYGIYGGDGAILSKNTAYNNQGTYGIYADTGATLNNNTAYFNQGWGIYANGANNIVGNTVTRNNISDLPQGGGLYIGDNSQAEHNTANKNHDTGIYVGGTGSMIRNNHATDSTGASLCIFFNLPGNAAIDNSAYDCFTEFAGSIPPASRFIGNIGW